MSQSGTLSIWNLFIINCYDLNHILLTCMCLCSQDNWQWRIGIPLNGVTPPHFCAFSKPGPGFPTSYVGSFFVYSVSSDEGPLLFCWWWLKRWPLLY